MSANKLSRRLVRLFSCGSGKLKDVRHSQLPSLDPAVTPPTDRKTIINDDEVDIDREVYTAVAVPGRGPEVEEEISYTNVKVIGKGTFGIVYRAKLCHNEEHVAIKKVFHDPKFKNREQQMMKMLDHPNILSIKYHFFTTGTGYQVKDVYLNIVMDYMPQTLYSVAKCDGTHRTPLLEMLYVKVYIYQLLRALAYLHAIGVAHRDIKPQNLLLNPETSVIKLCDFGSAKEMITGEANIAYICSRYYRAPELILGATDYTTQIDVWSAGCVLAELVIGEPLFPGADSMGQLVEIIKILGTPTPSDIYEINHNYQSFTFPTVFPVQWSKALRHPSSPYVPDVVSKMLVYSPTIRITPLEGIGHPFFDELRDPNTRLHRGRPLPPLFNFTTEELTVQPDLNEIIVPAFLKQQPAEADCGTYENQPTDGNIGNEATSAMSASNSSLDWDGTPNPPTGSRKKRSQRDSATTGQLASEDVHNPVEDETEELLVNAFGGASIDQPAAGSGSLYDERPEVRDDDDSLRRSKRDGSKKKSKKRRPSKQEQVDDVDIIPIGDRRSDNIEEQFDPISNLNYDGGYYPPEEDMIPPPQEQMIPLQEEEMIPQRQEEEFVPPRPEEELDVRPSKSGRRKKKNRSKTDLSSNTSMYESQTDVGYQEELIPTSDLQDENLEPLPITKSGRRKTKKKKVPTATLR